MSPAILLVIAGGPARQELCKGLRRSGYIVKNVPDADQALACCARRSYDVILLDLGHLGDASLDLLDRLRRIGDPTAVIVLSSLATLDLVSASIRRGADDFVLLPTDAERLLKLLSRTLERRRLAPKRSALSSREPQQIAGASPPMQRLLDRAGRAARSDATILLTGETGSGKQLIADYIHRQSPRRDGPLVYVNCVAISDDLVESTLFGHERGAFTGAVDRKNGRLELARGGTIFLDEIGDISAGLQAKLLHFLEAGEFERVGSNQTLRVDCRVIAATNRDLATDVACGRFRGDLLYRLDVITLHVPPLRERRDDILPLAHAFLEQAGEQLRRPGLELAPRTSALLAAYDWPGNVRQLRNLIERMAVLASDDLLTPDLLPADVLAGPGERETVDESSLSYRGAVSACKRRLVCNAMQRTGGNQTRAAQLLGLQRSYLNRLIKDLGLDR